MRGIPGSNFGQFSYVHETNYKYDYN
jgi:hypothetical protein